jgi:hypothetical protein
MLPSNSGMQRLAAKSGFDFDRLSDPQMVVAVKDLRAT